MKYIVNYSDRDQTLEVPDDATLDIESIAAGEGNSHITMLTIRQGNKILAAFVGAMRFYPESMEPERRTWA